MCIKATEGEMERFNMCFSGAIFVNISDLRQYKKLPNKKITDCTEPPNTLEFF